MPFSSLECVSSLDSNPKRVNGLAVFATTRWSVVFAAGGSSSPESEQALSHLCRTYWYPLYAFVRRQGRTPEDAEDLTQGFFAHVLEEKALRAVEPHKGKFRSFLLASLKNFLANDWDRRSAAASVQFSPWMTTRRRIVTCANLLIMRRRRNFTKKAGR